MKKKIFFTVFTTLLAISINACSGDDDFNNSSSSDNNSNYFCRTISGYFSDPPNKLRLDNAGDMYIAGAFKDTIDFNPNSEVDNRTSINGYDTFITKIKANGSYGWTKTIGDFYSVCTKSIALDKEDNIYITGHFSGTVDFDPSAGTDNHQSHGYGNIFITKINKNGTYGWTKTIRHSGNAITRYIELDNSGNIYIAGQFNDTFYSNNVTTTNISNGGSDIFIIKFDPYGSYGWTKTIGGTSDDTTESMIIDNADNIYLTGSFGSTVDFDPNSGIDSHSSHGQSDIFIVKINANGTYGWTKTMGGFATDRAYDVVLDKSGNMYVTGGFGGTADFDPGPGTDNHTSNSDMDIFLTRINADGTYGWTKTMGGFSQDFGKCIALNGTDNVYLAGHFRGTIDFDPSTGIDSHRSNGDSDIFITKFHADGSYVWTKIIGGTGYDHVSSMILDNSDQIHMIGKFSHTVDFDPGHGIDNHTAGSTGDIFVIKLDSK